MLHPDWFKQNGYLMTMVELDVSNNMLTELPDCLPWQFQNLRYLNVSRNMIKHLSYSPNGDTEDDPLCPR